MGFPLVDKEEDRQAGYITPENTEPKSKAGGAQVFASRTLHPNEK